MKPTCNFNIVHSCTLQSWEQCAKWSAAVFACFRLSDFKGKEKITYLMALFIKHGTSV